MKSSQIDKVCIDWLEENYGEELASEYNNYSLVIPTFNSYKLNDALDILRQVLCISFGQEGSFGTTDYHEARRKIGLRQDLGTIPEIFIKAFSETVTETKASCPRRYDLMAFPAVLHFKRSEPVKKSPGFHLMGPLRNLMDTMVTRSRETA